VTDGAETPPPETTLTPTAQPTVEDRLKVLEDGLKDLAEIGKSAYDDIVARLSKLEASPPIPDVSVQPPGPLPPPHDGPDRVEKVTVVNP